MALKIKYRLPALVDNNIIFELYTVRVSPQLSLHLRSSLYPPLSNLLFWTFSPGAVYAAVPSVPVTQPGEQRPG